MRDGRLTATSLKKALALVQSVKLPVAHVEVLSGSVHAELWIKDSKTIVLAQMQPGDLTGWHALYALLQMPSANFFIGNPQAVPEFPDSSFWIEIDSIYFPEEGQSIGSGNLSNSMVKGLQVPASFALEDSDSDSDSDEDTSPTRQWVKKQLQKLQEQSQRSIYVQTAVRRTGTHQTLSAHLQEVPPEEEQEFDLRKKLVRSLLASVAAAILVIGLSAFGVLHMARTRNARNAADASAARAFAEDEALELSTESRYRPSPLPRPAANSAPAAATVDANGNQTLGPVSAPTTWPTYYSKEEVADLSTIAKTAEAAQSRGSLEEAVRIYLKALEKYPESVRLRLAAAKAFVALGKPNDARLMCLQGIQAAVNQQEADVLRAYALTIR